MKNLLAMTTTIQEKMTAPLPTSIRTGSYKMAMLGCYIREDARFKDSDISRYIYYYVALSVTGGSDSVENSHDVILS